MPAWPTRWPKNSFKSVWTWLIAIFIAGLFISVFIFSLKNPPQPVNVSPFEVFGLQFVIDALLVGLVLATLRPLSGFTLRELGFRVPNATTLLTALVGFVAMVVVANGSEAAINYFAKNDHSQDVIQMFKHLHDPGTIAVFVGFAVIFAPFVEETIFRVFFFNLGLRYGGFWGGAVVSGVLFGIAHGDLYAAVPLALGGIVLCAVYYRTRNAYASMISHALFNALAIVLLLAFPKLT
ncbi:MAG: type II CAAX endopeptidase family protein [Candidatus Cybelea sp.]